MPEIAEYNPSFKLPLDVEKEKKSLLGKAFTHVQQATEFFMQSFATKNQALEKTLTPEKIQEVDAKATELSQETLRKISEQLGSNPGGWYEHAETGEKFYVKIYNNPERAQTEFIANAVYAKLGISAAQTELCVMDDQLAIASKEIPGSKSASSAEQTGNPEVTGGFVADAYLANWDVVGLCYDNIVKGEDGHMHRIDNGGALTYRAQGGKKGFEATDIPELESMRNLDFNSGKVFENLAEEEIRTQAKELVGRISDADIDQIIEQSGLVGESAETIRQGLKGRRQFLIEKYGLAEPKSDRWQQMVDHLEEMTKKFEGLSLRPKEGIRVDRDKIEGQQIDIIDARDKGKYEVIFKLTASQLEVISSKQDDLMNNFRGDMGLIKYQSKNPEEDLEFTAGSAIVLTLDENVKVSISLGPQANRSAVGLVKIEINADEKISAGYIREQIKSVFERVLDIPEGVNDPDAEAEKNYGRARYLWQHKLRAGDVSEEQWQEIESHLERQEVMPGYSTFVEKGKSQEYKAISPYVITHKVYTLDMIPKIIKGGGLLASQERYKRGLMVSGMSTSVDFEGGGADSIFTRIITQESQGAREDVDSVTFIFDPDLLERTDWYAYAEDTYGRTDPTNFETRQSPEEVFAQQRDDYDENNEQMFRNGIPVEKMKAITVPKNGNLIRQIRNAMAEKEMEDVDGKTAEELVRLSPRDLTKTLEDSGILELAGYPTEQTILFNMRMKVIYDLTEEGITEINGKPVQDFVVEVQKNNELINIANDLPQDQEIPAKEEEE